MLILALNGSPHRDGNTARLLSLALETARAEGVDTRLVHAAAVMAAQKNPFCVACASPCPGRCYRGSELESVLRLVRQAGGVILGSPVYFGTVSAQLKAFWDKTRLLRSEQALLNTVGAAVTTGAARFGGQETTIKALHDMMLIQGMIVVGDGHSTADPGHHGACAQQPAADDANAARRAKILALRVVEVARATAGLRSG